MSRDIWSLVNQSDLGQLFNLEINKEYVIISCDFLINELRTPNLTLNWPKELSNYM